MNAMETRKLAQELGIKNAARFKKDVLEAMIAEKQADAKAKVSAALQTESETKVAKVKAAKKVQPYFAPGSAGKCVDCGRKGDPNSPSDGRLCNAHSNGHEEFGEEAAKADRSDACWLCNPALDQTVLLTPLGDRAGTSRLGMRMTVPVRSAAEAKAGAVIKQLPEGAETAISNGDGLLRLDVTFGPAILTFAWDSNSGAWSYEATAAQTEANARWAKIRNASAGLRLLGV